MLIDDRVSHVERYFAAKTTHLPEPMKVQLEIWLEVMLDGSSTAPRQRSRDPRTARIHIMGIPPIIEAWADAGHQSLDSADPAMALAVALVAFHALTAQQLTGLQLTDIVDGRLHLGISHQRVHQLLTAEATPGRKAGCPPASAPRTHGTR